jgi:hypothetical protein
VLDIVPENVRHWRLCLFTVLSSLDSLRFFFLQTDQLEVLEEGTGTRLFVYSRLHEPTPGWFGRLLHTRVAARLWRQDLERLAEMIPVDLDVHG